MADLVPQTRQIRRKDGTTYQAVRHVKAIPAEASKKEFPMPQPNTNKADHSRIYDSLTGLGYSESSITFVIDKMGEHPSAKVSRPGVMAILSDCVDVLGEDAVSELGEGDREAELVAERLTIAAVHALPANDRVRKLITNPDIDMDRLIHLMKEERVTDPAKLELIFDGGSSSLSEGAL